VKRVVARFLGGMRERSERRRRRAVRRALVEASREPDDGTIWRSGKGGYHYR
jgi:hypothetical protein